MEDCQREMTLGEWMAKLPESHRANQELTKLRAENTALRKDKERLDWLQEQLIVEDDGDVNLRAALDAEKENKGEEE